VQTRVASRKSHARAAWLRRNAFFVRLTGCFVWVALATAFIGFARQNNVIWVANGVLLAYLLLASRKRWAAYLVVGFAAQVAGAAVVNPLLGVDALFAALHVGEVLLCLLLLRRRSNQIPDFTHRPYLLRFLICAALISPLVSGSIFALISPGLMHISAASALIRWYAANSLGFAVATPTCVAVLRSRFHHPPRARADWSVLLLLIFTTLATFSQSQAPLAFVIYPVLVLVLLRLGLGWAALSTLFVAGVGSWSTLHGLGPFSLVHSATPFQPAVLLQAFVTCGMFMLYSVSMVLESQHAAERRLQKIAALHTVVTENSRDAIIVADFEGRRSYASPAVENLVGWTPDELINQRFTELAHPEDQPRLDATLRELQDGAEGAIIEYRAKRRDGNYIWLEASLRLLRDRKTDAPTGVLNFTRDISERKQAEKRLQDAYDAVEALAVTDALTGLANRRRFDQYLAVEWRRGLRDRKPLSLLMIDVDLFKSYNDNYGHVRGDSCLKQIAESALDVVGRPGDLIARFGGEEFAVILPNTPNEGALCIANDICESLRNRRLPHIANPLGHMTISVGCATMIPRFGLHSVNLVELADEALYFSKRNGRNQVCNGNTLHEAMLGAQAATQSHATVGKGA
jgi:diguanylate cyclase (GGDEF)-like protein/PAS domain S-box-containing protein